jgi:hypothetical protein
MPKYPCSGVGKGSSGDRMDKSKACPGRQSDCRLLAVVRSKKGVTYQ